VPAEGVERLVQSLPMNQSYARLMLLYSSIEQ
jgi:hypothetical protein